MYMVTLSNILAKMEVSHEFVNGKKLNSKLLYTGDHHLFERKNKSASGDKFNCYVKHCMAKVLLIGNKCFYDPNQSSHCHQDQTSTYNSFNTEAAIKNRCKSESKAPRKIYNEECSTNNEEGIQYEKRRRHLQRIQSKKIPKSPSTMIEVMLYFALEMISSVFGEDKNKLFHWKSVNLKNFGYTILISESILNSLPDIRKFRVDGTFKCVPRGPFMQLLIISVDVGNHTFPCIYVLLTRKTKVAYMHLFKTIEQEFKLRASSITTDYEKGLRSALRCVYPEANILGCWFHYSQAIRRKAASLKTFLPFIRTNPAARKLYHKFLCLPLMRSDTINLAFEILKVEANTLGEQFHSFVDYFEQQWIRNEGAKSISLFLESHRTNNLMEGYNSDLNSKIQFHGNMYRFLEILQEEETIKSREFRIASKGGTQIYPEQRKKLTERDNFIFQTQTSFDNNTLNVVEFFDRIINYVDLEQFDLDMLDDSNDSSDADEQDADAVLEERTVKKCAKCLSAKPDTIIIPCDHVLFCYECIHSMYMEKRKRKNSGNEQKCPQCYSPITSYKRVFL